jgi:hypothetical protein
MPTRFTPRVSRPDHLRRTNKGRPRGASDQRRCRPRKAERSANERQIHDLNETRAHSNTARLICAGRNHGADDSGGLDLELWEVTQLWSSSKPSAEQTRDDFGRPSHSLQDELLEARETSDQTPAWFQRHPSCSKLSVLQHGVPSVRVYDGSGGLGNVAGLKSASTGRAGDRRGLLASAGIFPADPTARNGAVPLQRSKITIKPLRDANATYCG